MQKEATFFAAFRASSSLSLSPAKQMSKSGHKDMDRIQMNEWMKEQKKTLVLCNTRVEEGWRDEAGLVSEGNLRVHFRIAIQSFDSQINSFNLVFFPSF